MKIYRGGYVRVADSYYVISPSLSCFLHLSATLRSNTLTSEILSLFFFPLWNSRPSFVLTQNNDIVVLCPVNVEFLGKFWVTVYIIYIKVKVKWSRYRPGVAQRVGRGIALLFHDRGTRRGERSAGRPGRTLPPGKTRYPFYRRLGGPQGRSGRAENLVHTGIRSRTVQPLVGRYSDWATRPTHTHTHTHKYIYTGNGNRIRRFSDRNFV